MAVLHDEGRSADTTSVWRGDAADPYMLEQIEQYWTVLDCYRGYFVVHLRSARRWLALVECPLIARSAKM